MANVYYWVLTHKPLFGQPIFFRFAPKHEQPCTNPGYAMRWMEYEDAEAYRERLKGAWTPVLLEFDGDAVVGAP